MQTRDHKTELRRPMLTAWTLALTMALCGVLFLWLQAAAAPDDEIRAQSTTDDAHVAAPAIDDSAHPPGKHDDGGGDDDDNGNRVDLEGFVVNTPTAFQGKWVISVSASVTKVVTVNDQTDVTDFNNVLPLPGAYIKVRGVSHPDGSLIADRIRPDEFEDGQVVVRLKSSTTLTGIIAHYDLVLVSRILESANIYLFETDEDEESELSQLFQDSRVQWAELNYVNGIPKNPEGDPYRTWKWGGPDAEYVNQGAFAQVNLAPALAKYQGDGIRIAVLDTGVALTHTALISHLVPGRDMIQDDNTPQDECCGPGQGHGTHVAGIIAAIAPKSEIMPVRVLDTYGRGNTFVLAYAIEWAVKNGADVINLSLGADFDSAVLSDAVASAVNGGVIIIAAAGNDNSPLPRYPAAYPHVLGVTAVDAARVKAPFANGETWVDLATPGVGITSTVVGPQGNGYGIWSGTSMATPFVAGAAVLARQRFPNASVDEIGNRLFVKGDDINPENPGYQDEVGRHLNIGAALIDQPEPAAFSLFMPVVERP
ncbi:MAG: S8 family serine peptidase [Anaerolineales bacterium]|nr:S8 family serine peptidase [Anaerolineales bacterium]